MVCLGFKPGTAGWKAQMNPLSYGAPQSQFVTKQIFSDLFWLKFEPETLR